MISTVLLASTCCRCESFDAVVVFVLLLWTSAQPCLTVFVHFSSLQNKFQPAYDAIVAEEKKLRKEFGFPE